MKAQELVYDAWEMVSKKERLKLARAALVISEDCSDAYLIVAEDSAKSPKKKLEFCQKSLDAALRSLPDEVFYERAYPFWLDHSTRPFMRSLLAVAQAEWNAGQRSLVISRLHDLLVLNPNDNQGCRYILLCYLLQEKDSKKIEQLFNKFPEDPSVEWLWGHFLFEFINKASKAQLKKMLFQAESANEMIINFLMDVFSVEDVRPGEFLAPDTEEAVAYVSFYKPAWNAIDGALDFVAEHSASYS